MKFKKYLFAVLAVVQFFTCEFFFEKIKNGLQWKGMAIILLVLNITLLMVSLFWIYARARFRAHIGLLMSVFLLAIIYFSVLFGTQLDIYVIVLFIVNYIFASLFILKGSDVFNGVDN